MKDPDEALDDLKERRYETHRRNCPWTTNTSTIWPSICTCPRNIWGNIVLEAEHDD